MVLESDEHRTKDKFLVKQIKEGGAEMDKAITFILQQYSNKIMNYLRSRYGQKEDAEDLLHEGVAVVIMNIRSGKFEGKSSIYSYLFSICKQMQSKVIRRDVSKENWEHYKANQLESAQGPDVRMIKSDMMEYVENTLAKLGAKCQQVLKLWSLNYSMTEIAKELSYANAQVAMNKKNSCMKSLSAIVKNEFQSSPFW